MRGILVLSGSFLLFYFSLFGMEGSEKNSTVVPAPQERLYPTPNTLSHPVASADILAYPSHVVVEQNHLDHRLGNALLRNSLGFCSSTCRILALQPNRFRCLTSKNQLFILFKNLRL